MQYKIYMQEYVTAKLILIYRVFFFNQKLYYHLHLITITIKE